MTTRGYCMVKIAQLDHAFSEFFELKASSIGGQSLKQKDRRRKRKGEKKINNKDIQ